MNKNRLYFHHACVVNDVETIEKMIKFEEDLDINSADADGDNQQRLLLQLPLSPAYAAASAAQHEWQHIGQLPPARDGLCMQSPA